jgi:hypothetical protein
VQILEIALDVCLVVLPRHPIHTRGCVLRKFVERLLQEIGVDLVEERGEPLLLRSSFILYIKVISVTYANIYRIIFVMTLSGKL